MIFGKNFKEHGSLLTGYLAKKLRWLLYDQFYTAESAPLTSPRTCEPGPGSFELIQNDGQFNISGGRLYLPAQTTPVYGDLLLRSIDSFTHAPGLAMFVRNQVLPGVGLVSKWGFANGAAISNPNSVAIQLENTAVRGLAGLIGYSGPQVTALSPRDLCLVCRKSGSYLFVDQDLVWVVPVGYNDPLWLNLSQYSLVNNIEAVGVIDLPANNFPVFDHRDLDRTYYSAAPASPIYFDITPDTKLSFDVGSVASHCYLLFRYVDGSNHWLLEGRNAPDLNYRLWEVVDGVYANRGTAGVFALNDHVDIVANGESISVFLNYSPVPIIQYNAAERFISETRAGHVGAIITNLTAQTLNGAANEDSVNFVGYGLATDLVVGPVAVNTEFTHESDFVSELKISLLPAILTRLNFRVITPNFACYDIRWDAVGAFSLSEYVGGVRNALGGGGPGTVNSGDRLVVICDGSNIDIYVNTTLIISYAAAIYQDQIDGYALQVGTVNSGYVSDIVTWLRNLGEAPLTKGAVQAAQAFMMMEQEG